MGRERASSLHVQSENTTFVQKGVKMHTKEIEKLFGEPGAIVSELQQIHINSCGAKLLHTNLFKLNMLHVLNMDDNKITNITLPPVEQRATVLRTLILSHNRILEFPLSLLFSPNLHTLVLSNNSLSLNGFRNDLSADHNAIPALQELHLSSNNLSVLSGFIYQLCNLKTLHLSQNNFSALHSQIVQLSNLTTLSLADNKFRSFPPVVLTLPKLQHLDLSSNNLSLDSNLPNPECHSLTSLNLQHNKISALSPWLCNFTTLTTLKLHDNQITSIASNVSKLVNLHYLSLQENMLSELPSELCTLTKLQHLYLQYNFITKLPSGMENMTSLNVLMLHDNMIAQYPEELLNMLPQLMRLSYSNKSSTSDDSTVGPLVPAASAPVEPGVPPRRLSGSDQSIPKSDSTITLRRPRRLSFSGGEEGTLHFSRTMYRTKTLSRDATRDSSGNLDLSKLFSPPSDSLSKTGSSGSFLGLSASTSLVNPSLDRNSSPSAIDSPPVSRNLLPVTGDRKMLPYARFRNSFEILLDEQDFSEARKEQLRNLDKEQKWALLCQYRGSSLDLLNPNHFSPKKSKYEGTSKSLCAMLSAPILPTLPQMQQLLLVINDTTSEASHFIDQGGIGNLVEMLSRAIDTRAVDIVVEGLHCLKALFEIALRTLMSTVNIVNVVVDTLSLIVLNENKIPKLKRTEKLNKENRRAQRWSTVAIAIEEDTELIIDDSPYYPSSPPSGSGPSNPLKSSGAIINNPGNVSTVNTGNSLKQSGGFSNPFAGNSLKQSGGFSNPLAGFSKQNSVGNSLRQSGGFSNPLKQSGGSMRLSGGNLLKQSTEFTNGWSSDSGSSVAEQTVAILVLELLKDILTIPVVGHTRFIEALAYVKEKYVLPSMYFFFTEILKLSFLPDVKKLAVSMLNQLLQVIEKTEERFDIECMLLSGGLLGLIDDLKAELEPQRNAMFFMELEIFECILDDDEASMIAKLGYKGFLRKLGHNLIPPEGVAKVVVNIGTNRGCVSVQVDSSTTGQDVVNAIVQNFPQINAKKDKATFGLIVLNLDVETTEGDGQLLDLHQLYSSYSLVHQIVELKILSLEIEVHIGEDTHTVQIDPNFQIGKLTLTLAHQFLPKIESPKYFIGNIKVPESESCQEYGLSVYSKTTFVDVYSLDETKTLLDYNIENNMAIGLEIKQQPLRVFFGNMVQTLFFDYNTPVVTVLEAINKKVLKRSLKQNNVEYGLFLQTPESEAINTGLWLRDDSILCDYYIPKEAWVKFLRKKKLINLLITVMATDGVVYEPIYASMDATSMVEDELCDSKYLTLLPTSYKIMCKWPASNYSGKEVELSHTRTFVEQGVISGCELYLQQINTLGASIWETPNTLTTSKTKSGAIVVESGSINDLIIYLTNPDHHDPQFKAVFLNTYTTFISYEDLLAKLVQRYDYQTKVTKNIGNFIQKQVLSFVRQWAVFEHARCAWPTVEKVFQDFFMSKIHQTKYKEIYDEFKQGVDTKEKSSTNHQELPSPRLPKHPTLDNHYVMWDIDPLEVARQLTLNTFSVYRSIENYELLQQTWIKHEEKAEAIAGMVNLFNRLSMVVATAVVSQKLLRNRVKAYTYFVRLGECLLSLRNFHLLMAVISGLNNSSVTRLKWSLAKVIPRTKAALKGLEKVMSIEGSFKHYRESIATTEPPCIPYMGVYLTDLVFIEEGNPSFVTEKEESSGNGAGPNMRIINWTRHALIHSVLANVLQFQPHPYLLARATPVQKMLEKMETLSEKELYALSLKYEPRNLTAPPE